METIDVTVTGGCQCGAVRYRATRMLDNAHLCHCRMCQKASGNLFAALVAAPNEDLVFTRGEPAVFASSDEADRGYCAKCGTPLFYRGKSGRTNLMIGTLDDPSAFPAKAEVGMEGRVAWLPAFAAMEDAGATEDGEESWVRSIRESNHQHPDHDTTDWPTG